MLRLLVSLDFSECSREALRVALQVADRAGSCELVILTVLDGANGEQSEKSLNEMEEAISGLHRLVGEELAAVGGTTPPGTKMHYAATRGTAAEEIITSAAAHHADVIVMGTHGRTGLNRLFAGSVAEKVVRSAPCSVLTVRAKK
ncbi:MAG: universal stress protein [Deltaproteobacteria bacterium]